MKVEEYNNMNWKKVGLVIVIIFLLISVIFVIWGMNPLGPQSEALNALETTDTVTVNQGDFITFTPKNNTNIGLIIYPGGHVAEESYAVLAHMIADKGYFVAIVPMPLHLAVFSPNKAQEVMESFPDITTWTIAGHSLGGSMASAFIHDNPDSLKALYLLASYPSDSDNLSEIEIEVLSLYGTNDEVLSVDIESTANLLPASASIIEIKGGNHAYFGYYGEQSGDGEATITREKQHEITVNAIVSSLDTIQ